MPTYDYKCGKRFSVVQRISQHGGRAEQHAVADARRG